MRTHLRLHRAMPTSFPAEAALGHLPFGHKLRALFREGRGALSLLNWRRDRCCIIQCRQADEQLISLKEFGTTGPSFLYWRALN